MSDFFPPLVLELKGKAGQLFTTLKGVQAEVAKTEKAAGLATTGISHNMRMWETAGKYATIGIAGAAVAVGAYSLKMAGDFQAHMTLLQTAAGESSKNMGVVSEGVKNLAVQTGTSLDQLSEGMYTVEKAGVRGADGLKILKAAAEGAKAENVDLSTATNALTSVMMSYHLKAKDAVAVENELVAGSGMAKTTMQEYAGSLAAVIPVASAAGIQFDQIGGAIATLTQHGTSAQESTQELANTIRNLQAPSLVSQKAMQQLGLNVNDVSTKLGSRGLTGTIDMITKAITSKMGPGGLVFVDAMKKSASASQDMQTMIAKMPPQLAELSKKYRDGSIGMKEYQTAFKGMGGAGTAMGTQFLSLSKSTQGFNQMLTSGAPGAQTFSKYLKDIMGGATGMNTALMLGGENMGYFKKATEAVGTAGRKSGSDISTWALTQKNFNVQLAQTWQAIQVAAVNIGTKLIPVVQNAAKVGAQFTGWLVKNPPILIGLASIIGSVLAAAITAYTAKLVLATAKSIASFAQMIAGGVKWVASTAAQFATAIAKGAVWLATSTAQFTAWLAKQAVVLGQGIVLWVRYGAMTYGPMLAKGAAFVAQSIAQMARWVASQATAFAQAIVKGAVWVAQSTAQFAAWGAKQAIVLAQGIVLWARYGAMLAAELIASSANWVRSTAVSIGSMVAQNAAMIAQKAVMLGSAVVMGIVTAAQWAWNAAMDANPIGLIILAIAALVAAIIFLVTHWKQVTEFLQSTWQNVGKFFQTVGNAIVNWWNGFWSGLVHWVLQTFGPLIQWLRLIWQTLQIEFQVIGNTLSGWWNGFWGGIASFAQSVFSSYVGWIQSVWGGIVGFFQSVGGAISNAWNGLWTGLGGIVQSAFGGVVSFIHGVINGVIDVINGAIGAINGLIGAANAVPGVHIGSIGTIPHFADGGVMPYSGFAMVGEAGPELVQLPAGARVHSNSSAPTQAALHGQSSSGGKSVTNNITVQAQTNASPNQIATSVGWELRLLG